MALKSYPNVPEFVPMEIMSFVAVAQTATDDYHEFSVDRPVTCAIAQIQAATTGVENATGLAVTITTVAGTSTKIKVAATAITLGDVINVIAW